MWKRFGCGLLALLAVVAWQGTGWMARKAEQEKNRVRARGPHAVSERAAEVHGGAFVVDLHADSLLWGRNLKRRTDRGHVDVPRLLEGGVGLQVFGVVTHSPKGQNYSGNSAADDQITLLALAQKWPPATWWSRYARAKHQARKLRWLAWRSPALERVGTVAELDDLIARRAAGEAVIGAFLGLEGAHALEGDPGRVEDLFDAGFRMLGLAHFFDNAAAGSAHGLEKGGLSELGRAVIRECERLGVVVDLAHVSPRAFREATAMATKPMVVSHGGVDGTCPSPRNLSDAELRALASTGGVIGVGLFKGAVCGTTVDATAAAIVHAANTVGVEHVALGSDFDGAVTAPVGADGLPTLTEALLRRGLGRPAVEAVLGGNVVRVLRETLPPGDA
ncbi:MAG: membrane dipeptidase [Acidobacteriota bacterium]